jgi:hypothetical protein
MGHVLLRILVYAVALALFLLLGWITDRLLRPTSRDESYLG